MTPTKTKTRNEKKKKKKNRNGYVALRCRRVTEEKKSAKTLRQKIFYSPIVFLPTLAMAMAMVMVMVMAMDGVFFGANKYGGGCRFFGFGVVVGRGCF